MTDTSRVTPGRAPWWQRLLPVVVAVAAVVALLAVRSLLARTSWRAVQERFAELPPSVFGWAALATLAGYVSLGLYDVVAIRSLQRELPPRRTMAGGMVAFAVSNALGFPLLTGSAIRLRLWTSWGLSAQEIARGIACNSLTFWLGASSVLGVTAWLEPATLAQAVPIGAIGIRALGTLALLAPAAYLITASRGVTLRVGGEQVPLPRVRVAVAQLVVALADWACAAMVLRLLLPLPGLSFPAFAGLFVAAQVVGVLSHVPGGLGVFEAGMLLLLKGRATPPELLGALLAFRAVYYVGPFLVAVVALGGWEVAMQGGRLQQWSLPARRVLRGVAPHLLSGATFAAGALLLFSGATPAVPERLTGLDLLLPLGVIEAAHLLASLMGAMLLLTASGLRQRLDGAWYLSVAALVVGILASLLKGFDWEEAILVSVVLVTLLPARRFFYRRSRLTAAMLTPGWLAAMVAVLLGTLLLTEFAYRHVSYRPELWWHVSIQGDAPRSLRALVAAAVLLIIASGRHLLAISRPERQALPTADELARVSRVLATQSGTQGFLALTADKSLLFAEGDDAFLMYGVAGRSWIAMGDPVGPTPARRELVWRFRELADRAGGHTVFYQVGPEHLGLYIDLGLVLSKLGEEAHVPLAEFTLEGRDRKSLRRTHTALGEREGCTVEIIPPSGVPSLLPDLAAVSTAWLAHHHGREKGFSLGGFDPAYLARLPVAIVRQRGRLVAFANLWQAADHSELSVDLMRHLPDAPNGTMDFLFTELMLRGRAEGYHHFNLGMAPLAGLPEHALAPLWSRVGNAVFEHGERFYGFQGLRQYKAKFDPVWVPRYLASPGGWRVPRALADVTTLISRSHVRAGDA